MNDLDFKTITFADTFEEKLNNLYRFLLLYFFFFISLRFSIIGLEDYWLAWSLDFMLLIGLSLYILYVLVFTFLMKYYIYLYIVYKYVMFRLRFKFKK